MDILLIGATGAIGSRLLKEAVSRGHDVAATDELEQPQHLRQMFHACY